MHVRVQAALELHAQCRCHVIDQGSQGAFGPLFRFAVCFLLFAFCSLLFACSYSCCLLLLLLLCCVLLHIFIFTIFLSLSRPSAKPKCQCQGQVQSTSTKHPERPSIMLHAGGVGLRVLGFLLLFCVLCAVCWYFASYFPWLLFRVF